MKKYHYVYRLENIDNNKYYIGCRSCSCDPKSDNYFSSSKLVKKLIKNGNIFNKTILKVFNNREDAILYEMFLHEKYNVSLNKNFYNKVKQTSKFFDTSGLLFIDGEAVTLEDYYKNDSLKYHTTDKVSVKNTNGETLQIDKNDDRYINGELKHVSSGSMAVYQDGRIHYITTKEYYKNKNKFTPTNLNKVAVRDKDKTFLIDKNDERFINGDLKSVHHGKVLCKDINGNILYVTKKYFLENKLVGINKDNISGNNNPNSKKIGIFNNFDELIFLCDGNFEKICNDNDLPYSTLKKSYIKNGKKIYNSKRGKTEAMNRNNEKYINWYAKILI